LGATLLLGVVAAAAAASAALSSSGPASTLDGRWKTSMTVADLVKTGEVNATEAASLSGPWTARFADGRFEVRNERTGGRGYGTFVVTASLVRFVFASGIGLRPGSVATCTANVHRDRLTFTKVNSRPCLAWNAAVWIRVG
jgi:hypothetical protein